MNKILIVDDDRSLRLLYKEELGREGDEVILAESGQEAIKRMKERRPDLIVLDIRMPQMDGIELLGKVLSKEREIPIIINTAYASYKDDFRTWGAEHYLIKSSDLSELKTKIKEVLQAKKKK